ncbi:hypothetical protein JCM11641_008117 [Rhodosporidiobolus odoratus]
MSTSTLTHTLPAGIGKITLNSGPDIKGEEGYKYSHLLPHYNKSLNQAPLEPFEHIDPGHQALKDPEPQAFLKGATVKLLSPKFGAEVDGVDFTKLDSAQRSQLALYVAQKGVVVFRNNQAFIDADPRWLIDDWTAFFSRPHTHPVSRQPKDFPEIHLNIKSTSSTATKITLLFRIFGPPDCRRGLQTLEAEHSGFEQAAFAVQRHGADAIKRQPVKHTHPVVRRHPVTGEKALYVNPGFTRAIVGLKYEESEGILKILYDHIKTDHDVQVRARWGEPGIVELWDNRVTAHSALEDSGIEGRRNGGCLTPQAERPTL